MIVGTNTPVPHEGVEYHIQIEDIDTTHELDARVYLGGRVLFQKRQSYADRIAGIADPRLQSIAIREELEKLLGLLKAAILKGRIHA